MDDVNLRKKIDTTFKLYGFNLRRDAQTFLVDQLRPVASAERQEWLERFTEYIQKLSPESAIIEKSLVETAVQECLRSGLDKTETVFNVISSFEVPRFSYDLERKKFIKSSEPSPELFGPPKDKAAIYRDRYTVLQQRTARHELFTPAVAGGGGGDADGPQKFRLSPVEYLLSCAGRLDDVVVLGMLAQLREGRFFLEDPTGIVQLDLSQAYHTGLFCENCFVLAEGWYDDRIFHIQGLGFPPAESSKSSRAYFGNVNTFGGPSVVSLKTSSKLLKHEQENQDAMIVFLADVWLDSFKVMDKLRQLFAGYAECPPVAFVLMGSFLSSQGGSGQARLLRARLRALADLVLQFPELAQRSRFVLVPGPVDPACPSILPRFKNMPLKYKRKTDRSVPALDTIQNAIREVVEEKMALRQTALKYGISKSSLSRYVMNRDKLPGADGRYQSKHTSTQIFTTHEENLLVEYVLTSSRMHYCLSTNVTRQLAYQFAVANEKKIPANWELTKLAGIDWLRGFFARNPELSVRKPEAISLSRATSFNKKNVGDFFDNLSDVYKRYRFEPKSIYNMNETAVKTVQNTCKVIAQKGSKQVGQMISAERGQLVTMCVAVNAVGNFIPPFYVFPRVHFKENIMLKGATPGSSGAANPSGWMSAEIFPMFLKHFVKHVKPSLANPVLLILDNHESHISVNAIDYAKENGITLLTLPPHCSNKLQPLDVSVFGPFKGYYNRALDSWMASNPGKTVSIFEVAQLSGQALALSFTPKNIQAGFSKCGIYPLNRDTFTDDDFLCSSVTDRTEYTSTTESNENIPQVSHRRPTSPDETATDPCASTNFQSSPTNSPNRTTKQIVTPEQLKPYPKSGPRKRQNTTRKLGRTRILTDTPVKAEVEAAAKRKKIVKKLGIKKITQSLGLTFKPKDSSSEDSSPEESGSISSSVSVVNCSEDEVEDVLNFKAEDLKQGTFVLVKFKGGSQCSVTFKYVCIVQMPPEHGSGEVSDEAELSVMALKSLDKTKKMFVVDESDVSFVKMSNVLGILPIPDLITHGDRCRYVFTKKVDVFEK